MAMRYLRVLILILLSIGGLSFASSDKCDPAASFRGSRPESISFKIVWSDTPEAVDFQTPQHARFEDKLLGLLEILVSRYQDALAEQGSSLDVSSY